MRVGRRYREIQEIYGRTESFSRKCHQELERLKRKFSDLEDECSRTKVQLREEEAKLRRSTLEKDGIRQQFGAMMRQLNNSKGRIVVLERPIIVISKKGKAWHLKRRKVSPN